MNVVCSVFSCNICTYVWKSAYQTRLGCITMILTLHLRYLLAPGVLYPTRETTTLQVGKD
jgi:hypothetical protein